MEEKTERVYLPNKTGFRLTGKPTIRLRLIPRSRPRDPVEAVGIGGGVGVEVAPFAGGVGGVGDHGLPVHGRCQIRGALQDAGEVRRAGHLEGQAVVRPGHGGQALGWNADEEAGGAAGHTAVSVGEHTGVSARIPKLSAGEGEQAFGCAWDDKATFGPLVKGRWLASGADKE